MSPFIIAISIILATIPAIVWGSIFYKKDPVSRFRAKETFALGMLAVTPILLYKELWVSFPKINIFHYTASLDQNLLGFTSLLVLPIGTVLAFMFVGVIEEIMKNMAVRRADRGQFQNIDDAIEYSVIAALGFAFVENILYFIFIWAYQGLEVLAVSFVFRSIFSTFAHVLFSGIYGYHYGIAVFAKAYYVKEIRQKKSHRIIEFIHKIFRFKQSTLFEDQEMAKGLFLAVFLHALFNIFLELNLTFIMIPFLVFGYTYLDRLFKDKENLIAWGKLKGKSGKKRWSGVSWRKKVA